MNYISHRKLSYIFLLIVLLLISCGGPSETELRLTIAVLEATTEAKRGENIAAVAQSGLDIEQLDTEKQSATTPIPPTDGGSVSSGANPGVEVFVPPAEPLFSDDFSNTNSGWLLKPDNFGTARISQQRLTLSAARDECKIVPIPNFETPDTYYAEVSVEVKYREEIVGFAFGEPPNHSWFGAGFGLSSSNSWINSGSPGQPSTSTGYEFPLYELNKIFNLGVEVNDSLYTLYVNGDALEVVQLQFSGRTLAIYTCDIGQGDGSQVYFDDLIVRESRE